VRVEPTPAPESPSRLTVNGETAFPVKSRNRNSLDMRNTRKELTNMMRERRQKNLKNSFDANATAVLINKDKPLEEPQ